MPFSLEPGDKSAQAALRRIAVEEIDGACAVLSAPGQPGPTEIHTLRKHTKKLRGLLRLVRPVFPDYRRENAVLRACAGQIAALRDAEVMFKTFQKVRAGLPDHPGFADIESHLTGRIDRLQGSGAAERDLVTMHTALDAMRGRARRWRLTKKGFGALDPGLARSWAQTRRAMRRASASARGDFNAVPFHAWRKPVKHHWYQARVLEPVWPALMTPHVALVDDLGEALGDHNDIDVLLVHLGGQSWDSADACAAVAALETAGLERRRALADAALATGRRLFAEPPEALVARWKAWRKLWRRGA